MKDTGRSTMGPFAPTRLQGCRRSLRCGVQRTGMGLGRSAWLRNQLMQATTDTAAATTEMVTPLTVCPCQVRLAPAVEMKPQPDPMQLNWKVVMARLSHA